MGKQVKLPWQIKQPSESRKVKSKRGMEQLN